MGRPSLVLLKSNPVSEMPPILFTTPTGGIFELTLDELPSHPIHSTTATAMDGENSTETQEFQLPKHDNPGSLDGTRDSVTSPPLQVCTAQRSHSQSCVSSSPLIEILSPEELLRKNTPDTPQSPTSPSRRGRRDGSRPRYSVKVTMEYNEYGELVEESTLRHHPTPGELSVTQLLRTIRKRFHHEVSLSARSRSFESLPNASFKSLIL